MLNNVDDDCSLSYGQMEDAFRALTKDDIVKPYKLDHIFKSSNIRADDIGYKLKVFDIRYQECFTASKPIEVECNFVGVVPKDVIGCALVITNKLVSIGSDGKRDFHLI